MTATLLARLPGAATLLPPEVDYALATVRFRAEQLRPLAAPLLRWASSGLVGLAVLAFGFLAIGPHVLEYRTMTMLTGSMAPEIDPGDVTVVTPLAVEDVTAGMVIAYHIPIDDRRVVTHRVVSVERGEDGAVTVQTKGDANEAADPWQATLQGDTAWQVRAVVPAIGHAISALRTPGVSEALRYGAVALVAGWVLMSIWRPRAETADTTATEEGTA